MLMSKKLSAAAVTTLNFITNQHRAILMTGFFQALRKFFRSQTDTANALNAFQDAGTNVSFRQLALPRCQIVERQKRGVMIGIDRGDDFGIVRDFHSQRRAPVKSFICRKYARTPRLERGQFQTVFIGLGTTIYQEQLIVIISAYRSQTFGKLSLKRIYHRIGIKSKTLNLLRHHLHIMRMTMPDADYGMTTIKIQIFLTFVVPNFAARTFYDTDIKQGIYIK